MLTKNSILLSCIVFVCGFNVAAATESQCMKDTAAYSSAATIRFDKELDLAFPGLRTLGIRIEEAKIDPNPIVLALYALELQAAEAASGKKSSYDSEQLLKDAVDLARCRGDVYELKAMQTLVPSKSKEFELTIKRINESADESSRGISQLVITNPREKYRVYTNGYFSGFAIPDRENWFRLGCPHHTTTLEIRTLIGEVVFTKRWEFDNVEETFSLGPDDLQPK